MVRGTVAQIDHWDNAIIREQARSDSSLRQEESERAFFIGKSRRLGGWGDTVLRGLKFYERFKKLGQNRYENQCAERDTAR